MKPHPRIRDLVLFFIASAGILAFSPLLNASQEIGQLLASCTYVGREADELITLEVREDSSGKKELVYTNSLQRRGGPYTSTVSGYVELNGLTSVVGTLVSPPWAEGTTYQLVYRKDGVHDSFRVTGHTGHPVSIPVSCK